MIENKRKQKKGKQHKKKEYNTKSKAKVKQQESKVGRRIYRNSNIRKETRQNRTLLKKAQEDKT